MALILTEEQQSLKDIASEFLQSNAPITHFREIRDTQNELGYDESLWMDMVNLGWSGILIPEEYGGFDFGMVGMGSILEEAGKTLTPSPLFSTGVLGASLLTLGGNDSQKQTYLPQIVDGTLTTALALEESNRHSPYSIDTQAKKNGDQFIISGCKNFVIDGHSSNLLIVAARTEGSVNDESGITLFLVNSDSQGLEITKTSMVDSRNAANIKFSDVTVSSDNILGEENNGASLLEVVLDRAQIAISAEMLGNASQAFNLTLEYLKERKQFGAVIGTFQAQSTQIYTHSSAKHLKVIYNQAHPRGDK
jgi:acyl-CoA dehydrogenase